MKKINDFWNGLKKEHKIIIVCAIVIIVLFVVLCLFLIPSKQNFEYSASSTLKEIKEISDLDTIEYTYNGVAKEYTDSKKKNVKYYVAYKGKVYAGFDIEKLTLEIDNKAKELIVTLPEIKINSVSVDNNSLEFIFSKDKYNTETVIADGYNLCTKDLKSKAEKSDLIITAAKENAEYEIRAMYEQWLKKFDKQYKLIIK